MSDVSVLSHEYQTASELSQTINRALITLKKAWLRLPTSEEMTPDDIRKSQRCLVEVLLALRGHLVPDKITAGGANMVHIPGSLVALLQQERRGDLDYFLEDLNRTVERLGTDLSDLTDQDIALLDHFAAAADEETSSVFRRLMRT
jgi:hypothetical protein